MKLISFLERVINDYEIINNNKLKKILSSNTRTINLEFKILKIVSLLRKKNEGKVDKGKTNGHPIILTFNNSIDMTLEEFLNTDIGPHIMSRIYEGVKKKLSNSNYDWDLNPIHSLTEYKKMILFCFSLNSTSNFDVVFSHNFNEILRINLDEKNPIQTILKSKK